MKRISAYSSALSAAVSATLVLVAGSAWGQAEQREDDSDSRTHLYSGLIESSELRRGKMRLSRKEWAFTAIGSAAAVYDSNVFRGPNPQSSALGNLAIGASARRNFTDFGRLKIDVAGGAAPYSRSGDVRNEYGARARAGYTHPLTDDLSGRLYSTFKYSNDHATDINGNPFIRDFQNLSYRVGSTLKNQIGDIGEIRISYEAKRKDYTGTPLLRSLDWWRHRVGGRYRAFVGSSAVVDIEYRFDVQQYDEATSQDSSGVPDLGVVERHFFHRVGLRSTWDVARWLELTGGYAYKRKDDRFEGYESYDSHRFKLLGEIALTTRLALETGTTIMLRRYDNRRTDLAGTTILEYNKYTFFVNGNFNLTKNLAAWAGYSMVDRNSNRTFGTSYRSYTEHVAFFGVTAAY